MLSAHAHSHFNMYAAEKRGVAPVSLFVIGVAVRDSVSGPYSALFEGFLSQVNLYSGIQYPDMSVCVSHLCAHFDFTLTSLCIYLEAP